MTDNEDDRADITHGKPVRGAIGGLLYLARLTRIDILYAVIVLARYQAKPSMVHWNAIQRILLYLANTLDKGLIFYPESMARNAPKLLCMSDASNGVHVDNYDSTGGHVIYMYGAPIIAKSYKIKVKTQSSTEAEYCALSQASRDVIHMINLSKALNIEMIGTSPNCSG